MTDYSNLIKKKLSSYFLRGRSREDELKGLNPQLDLKKHEEYIIKASADGGITKQAITQEFTLFFKDREANVNAVRDSYDEHRQLKLSKDEAKLED